MTNPAQDSPSGGAWAAGWALLAVLAIAFSVAGRWAAAPRLFLDAYTPPQPYRWVSPPPEFTMHNEPPSGGETVISFRSGRSDPASAFTDDGQVTVSFNIGTFRPRPGQTGVRVRITPVRPQPSPPGDLILDGNAYTIEASYVPSGQPATPLNEPTLIDLRFPGVRPDAIYQIDNGTWTPIGGTVQDLLLTIDARSSQLGTFAAAHHVPPAATGARPGFPILGAVLAVSLLLLLLLLILVAAGARISLRQAPKRAPAPKPRGKRPRGRK